MKGRRTHLGEIFEPPLKVIWYTIASETYFSQECIPVGCVPSAAVAVGGGCIPACTGQGWVCIPACTGQGVSTPPHSMDRILDTRLGKHYLSATTLRTLICSAKMLK